MLVQQIDPTAIECDAALGSSAVIASLTCGEKRRRLVRKAHVKTSAAIHTKHTSWPTASAVIPWVRPHLARDAVVIFLAVLSIFAATPGDAQEMNARGRHVSPSGRLTGASWQKPNEAVSKVSSAAAQGRISSRVDGRASASDQPQLRGAESVLPGRVNARRQGVGRSTGNNKGGALEEDVLTSYPQPASKSGFRQFTELPEVEALAARGKALSKLASFVAPPPLWNSHELPSFARPIHYKLKLEPNVLDGTFQGVVQIEIDILQETRYLVFHADGILFDEIWFIHVLPQSEADDPPIYLHVLATKKNLVMLSRPDQIMLVLDDMVYPKQGRYVLKVRYKGTMRKNLQGVYTTRRTAAINRIVATKFEPISARTFMPCWDEPRFKARFVIKIVHDRNIACISNMPVKRKVDLASKGRPGFIESEFHRTKVMSTYILAFSLGNYVVMRSLSEHRFRVSLLAEPDQILYGKYALDKSVKGVVFYEKLLRNPYFAPKLDLIVKPGFPTSAVEAWGLLTFKRSVLLIDEERSSERQKARSTRVMMRMLAHQWFGNLATMTRFNHLWMKEGAANFLHTFGGDHLEPGFQYEERAFCDQTLLALRLDALVATQPLSQKGELSNADIYEAYNEITLDKGSAILRMMAHDVVGFPYVWDGISAFLKEYRFRNFAPRHFFSIVGNYSRFGLDGLDVFMETWYKRPGYPLIELSSLDNNEVTARQRRFSYTYPHCVQEDVARHPLSCADQWHVPITCLFGHSEGEVGRGINIMNSSIPIIIKLPPKTYFVKCNVRGRGFYRVSYSDPLWANLSSAYIRNPLSFHPLDRASIISDIFALTWFRHPATSVVKGLDLLASVARGERTYTVWETILYELARISRSILDVGLKAKFRAFMMWLVRPVYNRLGWLNTGTHQDKLLRQRIIEFAVDSGMNDAIVRSERFYDIWYNATAVNAPVAVAKERVLDPDIRIPVLISGIRKYGAIAFDHMLNAKLQTAHPSMRYDLLVALARGSNETLLSSLLAKIATGALPRQDIDTVLKESVKNPSGTAVVWDFLVRNWDYLYDNAPIMYFGKAVRTILAGFAQESFINNARGLFGIPSETNLPLDGFGHEIPGAGGRGGVVILPPAAAAGGVSVTIQGASSGSTTSVQIAEAGSVGRATTTTILARQRQQRQNPSGKLRVEKIELYVKQGLELAENRIWWIKRHSEELDAWLTRHASRVNLVI